MPRLVIIGPDGCGKDTLARALSQRTSLRYPEPTSLTWARGIQEWQDGRDLTQWWRDRRHHRDEWIDAANRLTATYGPTAIADRAFNQADIYTGLRHQDELSAVLISCNIDMVVWCWNPSLRVNHGISLSVELAADMTLAYPVQWILAQPHKLGVDRIIVQLQLPVAESEYLCKIGYRP